jgi:chemotaxis protein methyltransferase CheR
VPAELSPRAVQDLLPLVASWTGFHPDAIRADALGRVARSLAAADGADRLLARAIGGDPAVVAALAEGVTVGETYFFRQPEHFRHLAELAQGGCLAPAGRPVRAWSAGCATGEEAYSLAATLAGLARLPQVEVVGTDLLERNVRAAERGAYGKWSFRDHCPMLHPVTEGAVRPVRRGDTVEVSAWVRRYTRFSVANVLEPQPALGQFDVIFCRNVLIYFSPESARRALENVAGALAPGGVLVLGPMDAAAVPPGLADVGPPGLNVYARRAARPAPVAARAPRPAAVPAAPPGRPSAPPPKAALAPAPPSAPEPIALHLRALTLLERGDLAGAGTQLERVLSCAPGYLPGLLQLALLRDRTGRRGEAARLMREILDRTASMPREETVPGPEDLAVGYLQASARAYLGPEGGGK